MPSDPYYMTLAEQKAHRNVAVEIVRARYACEPFHIAHSTMHADGSVSVSLSIKLDADTIADYAERKAESERDAKAGGK